MLSEFLTKRTVYFEDFRLPTRHVQTKLSLLLKMLNLIVRVEFQIC